jgi:xylan 1,4-beta-xylosidase
MVWHYHDDDVAGPDADVRLNLTGLPTAVTSMRLRHYRIDRDHSNAFTAWQRLGSPAAPTPAQYIELEKFAQLAELESAKKVTAREACLPLTFALPRQAVSLLTFEWN